jgi:hypothetical protein
VDQGGKPERRGRQRETETETDGETMERGLTERKTETAAVSLPIAIPRSTQWLAVGP